jgi:putative heme-binding domain-containing protein
VEVVFENVDIMPHNLVFTSPGSLAAVGIAGEEMVAQPDAFEKQFVPDRPEVLFASKLLQPGEIERIRFTAPTALGEYPYVCTFPGHWRRMYGTMHVVSSLDAVPLETLAPSSDPEIQTRPFVRSWTFDDLVGKLDETGGARSFERGRELFTAVSCVQCHRVNGAQGGQVGPDLVNVKKKLEAREMLRADVLRELIEPSSKIDQAYATTVIVDAAGRVHTGIVAERNQTQLRLVANPLDGREPITISREDVEEEIPSKVSMMPAGLLNTLTEDEIFDLLGYVESAGDPDHTVFAR